MLPLLIGAGGGGEAPPLEALGRDALLQLDLDLERDFESSAGEGDRKNKKEV